MNEHVLPAEEGSNVGEGCVTVTWAQLNWELLRLTGEAKYAEQLEHTVYNALLAAQAPRTGDICYFTPLNGKKSSSPGINCCVSSEPRGISMIPQFAWGTRDGAAAVLFYVPGDTTIRTNGGEVTIHSETNYPADGVVTLTVNTASTVRFPLVLRVPAWTSYYAATVEGAEYEGIPGQYLTIEREWKPGDQVRVRMDMTVRSVPGGPSYANAVAIFRGPQLLALEQEMNKDFSYTQALGPRDVRVMLKPVKIPFQWQGTQAYAMQGKAGGQPRELILVPFADAQVYRVWLTKP
jgi:hypothetical protein